LQQRATCNYKQIYAGFGKTHVVTPKVFENICKDNKEEKILFMIITYKMGNYGQLRDSLWEKSQLMDRNILVLG
jgi:hypothetical protein